MWCDEASKYCENCCAKIVVVFSSSHSAYILQYVKKLSPKRCKSSYGLRRVRLLCTKKNNIIKLSAIIRICITICNYVPFVILNISFVT